MALEALRTFDDPFYTMTVTLDGSDYLFEFKYNQRESCWYFDISLTDGSILVPGVKVVCNRSLLGRFADERLPQGILFAWPNTSNASPPGLTELGDGKRVTLIYLPKDEPLE